MEIFLIEIFFFLLKFQGNFYFNKMICFPVTNQNRYFDNNKLFNLTLLVTLCRFIGISTFTGDGSVFYINQLNSTLYLINVDFESCSVTGTGIIYFSCSGSNTKFHCNKFTSYLSNSQTGIHFIYHSLGKESIFILGSISKTSDGNLNVRDLFSHSGTFLNLSHINVTDNKSAFSGISNSNLKETYVNIFKNSGGAEGYLNYGATVSGSLIEYFNFFNNTASNSGVVKISGGVIDIKNSRFAFNLVSHYTGGFLFHAWYITNGHFYLTNCIICHKSDEIIFGGVHFVSGVTITTNTIPTTFSISIFTTYLCYSIEACSQNNLTCNFRQLITFSIFFFHLLNIII